MIVIFGFSGGVSLSSVLSSSYPSKVMSENVGIDIGSSSNASSICISKSLGSGNASVVLTGCVALSFVSFFVCLTILIGCSFARLNAACISSGISDMSSSGSCAGSCAGSAVVVGAGVGGSLVLGGVLNNFVILIFFIHFGDGISNKS